MKMKIVFIWRASKYNGRHMKESRMLGVLNGKTEDQVIEVALQTEADGAERIQLCCREWASGIGWYTQKTMEFGNDQVDRLIRILEKGGRRPGSERPINNVVPFTNYGA
jgi:hypothetical protein